MDPEITIPLPGDVTWSEGSFTNSRGSKLYTQQWVRPDPKAIIVYIHGYGDHSHWLIKQNAEKMVNRGLSAFAFDQEGHGKSDGITAYVPSFDALAEDAIQFITYAKSIHPSKKCFVYGGSMGGGIVLLVALKQPNLMDGLILSAPMLKVADSAKPSRLVVEALKGMAYFFPTWAIVPNVDVIDLAFREEKHRAYARNHPYSYQGRVRLGTGLSILNITDYLQANLAKITQPLLILHGTADLVTAPETSEALFEASASRDKTLKLYEGLWHVLPLEPIADRIDKDVEDWIIARLHAPQACALKDRVPFIEPQTLVNTLTVETPAIDSINPAKHEAPNPAPSIERAPAKDDSEHETNEEPIEEHTHYIPVSRDRDAGAQLAMQTDVITPRTTPFSTPHASPAPSPRITPDDM